MPMARCVGRPNLEAMLSVSRRRFMGGALVLAGSAAVVHRLPGPAGPRRAVVAFHADRLYLDQDPAAEPYVPPAGLRSLDGMDEMTLRRLVYVL